MVTLHIRPIVLWREGHAHCECIYANSAWTLRLWVGHVAARERNTAGVESMLRTAQLWRETLAGLSPAAREVPSGDRGDRRHSPTERRAVVRGGRRGRERSSALL